MEHYRSLNRALQERFGRKIYKLALDGGFTCPTRDGTLGTGGCIFCAGGSGDFAIPVHADVNAAIETAKLLLAGKGAEGYIAYFQSYTGTYAPLDDLKKLYDPIVQRDDIAAISIGTRPDCLDDDIIDYLGRLNQTKPVWIELGLQTIHESTAAYIRRGYSLPVYERAVRKLKAKQIEVITHMILGLPGETPEMMRQTAEYIGNTGSDGIKFQLLHVLKGTDLAKDYEDGKFQVLSLDEYIAILMDCIEAIPEHMIVHRLTGDGSKRDLIAPLWSGDKKRVLNAINTALDNHQVIQGARWQPPTD